MKAFNHQLESLHNTMNKVTGKAYKFLWLVSNPILARSYSTCLTERHLTDDEPNTPCWTHILKMLALYYLNNGKNYFRMVRYAYIFKRYELPAPAQINDALCIDTVLYLDDALSTQSITLCNMGELQEELIREGKNYVLCPDIYGELTKDKMIKLFELVKRTDTPILFNFQFFSVTYALELFAFYLFYPFVLLFFLLSLRNTSRTISLIKDECIKTLGFDVIQPYKRFLHGKRLGKTCKGKATILSWHENRAGDKLFYRGLRKAKPSIEIVGLQTYLMPVNYIGAHLNSNETDLGFGPDRIVVNGPYYLPDQPLIKTIVGHSIRYSHIFSDPPKKTLGQDVLVLLSGHSGSSGPLLRIVLEALGDKDNLVIRLHPTQSIKKWIHRIPANAKIAQGSLADNLKSARLVIGTETGSLIEAVASGIPTIDVDTMGKRGLDFMPELGKGTVWFAVDNANDLREMAAKAEECTLYDKNYFARQYRETFFCNPLEGSSLESFGILQQNPATPV